MKSKSHFDRIRRMFGSFSFGYDIGVALSGLSENSRVRKASIIVSSTKPDPEAYFWVRFKPKMSIKENIRFSCMPMMIFMGFRGFRSKYWAVNYKTGLCQGLYEWQTVEDAENYSKSIAMKFMKKRSYPGSIEYKIIDKEKELLEYEIK